MTKSIQEIQEVHVIHIRNRRENNQPNQGSQYTANLRCIPSWSLFFRADTSGGGKIIHAKEMACLYKKQSKKGVKIFDCFQHLVLKSFTLIRCYLDLKNSIKSKFTIKTISMSSRLILFRDDNFFDIFYSMFHFVIEESRNSKKSMFFYVQVFHESFPS